MTGASSQPILAKLKSMDRARLGTVGLQTTSSTTTNGMVGPLGQPSSAKLRPMGRARPGVVGLSGVATDYDDDTDDADYSNTDTCNFHLFDRAVLFRNKNSKPWTIAIY